jgi:hypothetical protein
VAAAERKAKRGRAKKGETSTTSASDKSLFEAE